jgi:hypothetical protein
MTTNEKGRRGQSSIAPKRWPLCADFCEAPLQKAALRLGVREL